LHVAINYDYEDLVDVLLAAGADVNAVGFCKETALYLACRWNRPRIVQPLLRAGANPNISGPLGTPLVKAIHEFMDVSVVQALVEAGADVNAPGRIDGSAWPVSPLVIAIYRRRRNVVNILLNAGARIDWAINVAAACDDSDEIVDLLLDAGADVNYLDRNGATPLLIAAYRGHESVVERLLDAGGANLEAKTRKGGSTALVLAARRGHQEIVRKLIDAGADIEAEDDTGATALMNAVTKCHENSARMLLEAGARTELTSSTDTLLFAALRYDTRLLPKFSGNTLQGMVTLLLATGAARDVNARDSRGRTALMVAASLGLVHVMDTLLDHPGVDVHAKDDAGCTALMHATVYTTKLLTVSRIDERDPFGENALMKRASRQTSENAQGDFFFAACMRGVDINATDSAGTTVLMKAAARGNYGMVVGLLSLDVDVNVATPDGRTALMLAAWEGHDSMVNLLLAHGANPGAHGLYGMTARTMALSRTNIDLSKLRTHVT
jgi:ankyrin repeat protein